MTVFLPTSASDIQQLQIYIYVFDIHKILQTDNLQQQKLDATLASVLGWETRTAIPQTKIKEVENKHIYFPICSFQVDGKQLFTLTYYS